MPAQDAGAITFTQSVPVKYQLIEHYIDTFHSFIATDSCTLVFIVLIVQYLSILTEMLH